MSNIHQFLASEAGPTAAEYAVMAGFVIAVLIGIVTAFGHSVSTHFVSVSSAIS